MCLGWQKSARSVKDSPRRLHFADPGLLLFKVLGHWKLEVRALHMTDVTFSLFVTALNPAHP